MDGTREAFGAADSTCSTGCSASALDDTGFTGLQDGRRIGVEFLLR
jgi:hypothetical protein